jgi:putative membrane-bound dehydrogenase-like protein
MSLQFSLRQHVLALVSAAVSTGAFPFAALNAEGAPPFHYTASPIELPEGYVAEVVAAPPLVQHPIMATVDDHGRLFVGDSSGVNLKKAELEKELPHRVLMLEDTNGDGIYDKSTVFADKLTFPQGCAWLDGSLYVASPPGIWRFTDTDGDGDADKREMIVRGFDYTGNAADIHGPFVHPNGRLYWCHGRKGHEVFDKDGKLVRKGKASGIWSCRPDGSDVQMHCGGGMDNPVEIDFTPEGEILGTVNLFHGTPRGDCIVHWLRGGVYPREDQGDAIAEFKRTGDLLPAVFNFGHVAVSGCTFYRSGALNPDWRGNMFVTHFNTQRVTRMEVTPSGASYKITPREFLKIQNADVHITDVLEDRDGTLLIVDTGGWFRAGCPSSLVAKPDVAGAIYRIRPKGALAKTEPWGGARVQQVWQSARSGDWKKLTGLLADPDAAIAHAAANALASLAIQEAEAPLASALIHPDAGVHLAASHALGALPKLSEATETALLHLLEGEVDRALEHQAMEALLRLGHATPLTAALRDSKKPALQRRALILLDQMDASPLAIGDVVPLLDAKDASLANAAADALARRKEWTPQTAEHLAAWVKDAALAPARLALIERIAKPRAAEPAVQPLITALLSSTDAASRRTAWRLLASSTGIQPEAQCIAALKTALVSASPGDLSLLLDAIAKLRTTEFDSALRELAADEKRPLPLRLKASSASTKSGATVSDDAFAFLLRVLSGDASVSSRIEAARVLGNAKLTKPQLIQLAPAVATLGPIELREVLRAFRKFNDLEAGTLLANSLKDAISLASLQESEFRTIFSNYPPDAFAILAPALNALAAEDDARRRSLDTLPALVIAKGRAAEGRKIFESGKGTCVACHRIGENGGQVGPGLSTIGQIRTERDLLESILFPSATIVREFEQVAVDTAGGESLLGVVRRQDMDTIVLADAAGQERTISRDEIAAMQTLPTSLMPAGLERTISEQELLDLVAFLRSRK